MLETWIIPLFLAMFLTCLGLWAALRRVAYSLNRADREREAVINALRDDLEGALCVLRRLERSISVLKAQMHTPNSVQPPLNESQSREKALYTALHNAPVTALATQAPRNSGQNTHFHGFMPSQTQETGFSPPPMLDIDHQDLENLSWSDLKSLRESLEKAAEAQDKEKDL